MMLVLIWSLRTAAVAAFCGLLLVLLRRSSAAKRNLILRIGIAVAWLLPLAALVAPRIEVPSAGIVRAFPSAAAIVKDAPQPAQSRVSSPAPTQSAVTTRPATRSFPWAFTYGLGVAFVLLRWAMGMVRLRRLRVAAVPTADPAVWRAAIAVPATYGRTILVPEDVAGWPECRIRAAVLHEQAHVQRRDWLWQTFASGLGAVQWFNPFAWFLIGMMRQTSEAAADDAVLADGLAPSDYARELLAVAATAGAVGPALAMARRSGVKDRVVAILAVSRDRRAPGRLTTVLLSAALAVSGVAVAGLAQKVAASGNSSVSLADIRQLSPFPSARWNLEGLPVATPDEVAADAETQWVGLTPEGKKRLSVRFAVDGYVESDNLRIWVEKPAKTVSYGSPHGNGQPRDGRNDGALGLTLDAPPELSRARVRVGRATGSYHAYGGKVPFKAVSEPISWPEGTFDGAKIDFTFPKALKDVDYRVFVLTNKGRVDVRDNEYEYTDDTDAVPKTVYIAVDDPSHVLGVGVETRAYQLTSFDLPLRPKGPFEAPKRIDSTHSIDLIRLSQGGKAWLPDGTSAAPVGTIASRDAAGPDERKLTLAFRVQGKSWFQPSLAANLGERYAIGGDWSGFLETKQPGERIGLVTMNVPKSASISPITVVLKANPWQVHADRLVGSGAGQIHLTNLGPEGKGWFGYRVVLDGVAPIDAARDLDIISLDGDGNTPSCMVERRATQGDPSYTIAVLGNTPIHRLILRSQAVERARFDNVHLTPNP